MGGREREARVPEREIQESGREQSVCVGGSWCMDVVLSAHIPVDLLDVCADILTTWPVCVCVCQWVVIV